MSKGILVWGAPHAVAHPDDWKLAFTESGQNYGNLLIGHGVRAVLDPSQLLSRSEIASPAEADERCRHVVIPAANFLWKDFDFGYLADFLEKTHLPVTMIGVGAQTNDRTISSPIHPNTLRLMRLVADRSAQIGVRGYYSAEVLAANGIHNVQVIGCPSLYSTRMPTLSIDTKRLASWKSLSLNLSRRVNRHAFHPERMRAIENTLLALALTRESTFVAQDEIEELQAHAEQSDCPPQVAKYFSESPPEVVSNFFRDNTRYFADIDRWAAYIRKQDISIGTRFHGNLIALINGTPALMVVHDSRTMEMCTLMGIPQLHVSDATNDNLTVERLAEHVDALDFTGFESAYRALYRRYVGFLTANGLPHTLMAL